MRKGSFVVVAPIRRLGPGGQSGLGTALQVRRQLGDELVAVADGGVDVRGNLGDQRVDPGEDAAELGVGGVRQADDSLASGVGERLDLDDLGVQGLEGRGGIERAGGETPRCTIPAVVWLRHGDLGELECSHGSRPEPADKVEP
jgi:hypothetical protein